VGCLAEDRRLMRRLWGFGMFVSFGRISEMKSVNVCAGAFSNSSARRYCVRRVEFKRFSTKES
jgi:hypothetical protein